jgi:hypothetical protein
LLSRLLFLAEFLKSGIGAQRVPEGHQLEPAHVGENMMATSLRSSG